METIMMIRSDMKLAGPGILIKYYSEKLLEMNYKVILCTGGGELINSINHKNIRYYKIEELLIENRGIINNLKAIYKIYKILKKEKVDIIHGFNAYTSFLSYLSQKMINKKIKVFNTVNGVSKEWVNKFLPMKIIAVSNFVKQRLLEAGVKEKKIIVLENGIIDLKKFDVLSLNKKFRNELEIKKDEILIGVVGMFTGYKGHIEAIKTFIELLKIDKKFKLCLVGDGPYKDKYEQFCKEEKLLDKIIFTGKRYDIPEVMYGIDLFLHLSVSETFGMVIVEAMSFGKPIIANNTGGIPEIVKNGENGFLVDKDNYQENAKLINSLMKNKILLEKIKEKNIKRVHEKYTITKTLEKLLEIYRLG